MLCCVFQDLAAHKNSTAHWLRNTGIERGELGAIQIMRGTLRGGGGLRQCHQMTQGDVIFLYIFELNFTAKVFKKLCFL